MIVNLVYLASFAGRPPFCFLAPRPCADIKGTPPKSLTERPIVIPAGQNRKIRRAHLRVAVAEVNCWCPEDRARSKIQKRAKLSDCKQQSLAAQVSLGRKRISTASRADNPGSDHCGQAGSKFELQRAPERGSFCLRFFDRFGRLSPDLDGSSDDSLGSTSEEVERFQGRFGGFPIGSRTSRGRIDRCRDRIPGRLEAFPLQVGQRSLV
nr:uncharacterized protein LOC109403800 [Aedes albopictus]